METKHIFLTKQFLYELSKENAKGLIDLLYKLDITHVCLSKERIEEKVINNSIDCEGIEIVQTSKQGKLWFCDLGTKERYAEIYLEANPESFTHLVKQLHSLVGINLDMEGNEPMKYNLNTLTLDELREYVDAQEELTELKRERSRNMEEITEIDADIKQIKEDIEKLFKKG